MNVYYVEMFCHSIGYVCEEDAQHALNKASKLLGFGSFTDYLCSYPAGFEIGSKIRTLIKDIKSYKSFMETRHANNCYFILYVGEFWCQACVDNLKLDAVANYNEPYNSTTLLVPKMHELKQCYRSGYEKDWNDEMMWYCEDWQDEGNV